MAFSLISPRPTVALSHLHRPKALKLTLAVKIASRKGRGQGEMKIASRKGHGQGEAPEPPTFVLSRTFSKSIAATTNNVNRAFYSLIPASFFSGCTPSPRLPLIHFCVASDYYFDTISLFIFMFTPVVYLLYSFPRSCTRGVCTPCTGSGSRV